MPAVADSRSVHQMGSPGEALAYLQETALAYLHSEFVAGAGEQGIVFLKNKLAQTLSLLMLQTYSLTSSYTFLSALIALSRTHPGAEGEAQPLNAMSTDLLLRVLHDLSLSLGSDVTLRSVRTKERLQRDAVVRDEIRSHHAASIAELLWKVLEDALRALSELGDSSDPRTLSRATAPGLAQVAMAVVGDYVSWIDIGLVVTVHTVPVLYNALQHTQHVQLRCVTADTLCEIVAKGMKPADKLALVQALNLGEVISSLEGSTRGAKGDDDARAEFREHLAKLANALCTELCKVAEDTAGAEAETRDAAQAMLMDALPLVLAMLLDEYDEPTEQVLPCIHQVLGLFKKSKRRAGGTSEQDASGLTAAQHEFIARLITLALQKLQFDPEFEWEDSSLVGGAADPDADEAEEDEEHLVKFHELRKQLQVILGAIAALDEPLVSSTTHSLVGSTLSAGDPAQLPWERAELALYATFSCGEVLASIRGNKVGLGPHSYVRLPEGPGKARNLRQSVSVYQSLPPNTLGEILQLLFRSNIAAHAHPVVQLQYFECAVRYASCFQLWPDLIPGALSAFLGERGLRHERAGMRRRINYLFYRFVREIRTAMPSEYVPKLLEGMQDCFQVRAVLPAATPEEDPLQKATERASAFDSQLYLFDTAGLLIAQLGQAPGEQVMLLKAITTPLGEQLHQAVQSFGADAQNLQAVLQAHHLILALSTLAKGFPDYDASRASEPGWIAEFKELTEKILLALTALNQFLIIREAARGAFARIVASTGPAVLPYIPTLINALVNEVGEAELVDLLGFFGLIINKYKENVRGVMDDLFTVLVNRIFSFLNQGVQGTDDAVRRIDTEKAYFALISSLISAGLDGVLLSEKNQPQLETVLQSLVYYAANAEPASERAAVNVLTRLVGLWGRAPGGGAPAVLPGFEQFMYTAMLPLVFQVPSKPEFDTSDAQSQMVFSELCGLLKTMQQARGDEFIQYLTTVYLPGVQCPEELALELAQNVQALDAKQLKRYLQGFIAKSCGA